jgi:hypothetical protein
VSAQHESAPLREVNEPADFKSGIKLNHGRAYRRLFGCTLRGGGQRAREGLCSLAPPLLAPRPGRHRHAGVHLGKPRVSLDVLALGDDAIAECDTVGAASRVPVRCASGLSTSYLLARVGPAAPRLALDARDGVRPMFSGFWQWLHDTGWLVGWWRWLHGISQSQATFLGWVVGVVTLVGGALFNAWLNRKRDNRLRREDQRGVATALRAELAGCRRALLTNAEQLKDPQANSFVMPDLAHSIRIMPEMVSKFGLLDQEH